MKLILFISALLSFGIANARVHASDVRFHNENQDTTRITEILVEAEKISNPNERILFIAEKFIDVPYVAHTLENDNGEVLTVNLDELDCTTYVETVLAMAIAAGERRTSWRDYLAALESLRYRGGELNGYPSRLHYMSDWIVDNSHRGNVVEITDRVPDIRSMTKTLDFMSRNADKYTALADSANLQGVKNFEAGYKNHKFSYIPWNIVNNKNVKEKLQEGDIVAMLSNVKNLDITHLGILIKDEKGVPYLLHASMGEGKVTKSKIPLAEYLRKNSMPGMRIIRIKE